ncbi:transcription factor JunD-like [Falco peregrinus]|uniref:transcription factor JunD-like n=1 Tax=Falco peregrinus TaxID=8954 RepID=UPI002478517D|nr:transcription factor JunD-like [Falco peregrinus]
MAAPTSAQPRGRPLAGLREGAELPQQALQSDRCVRAREERPRQIHLLLARGFCFDESARFPTAQRLPDRLLSPSLSGSVNPRHLHHYPAPFRHGPDAGAPATRALCSLSPRRMRAVAEASPGNAHGKPLVPAAAASPAPQPPGERSGERSGGSPRALHRGGTGAAAGGPFAQARRAGEGARGPAAAAGRWRRGGQSAGPGRGPAGGGGAAAAARGGPEAALGSAAELPLLKLPPAADLEQLLIQGGAGLGAGSPGPAAPGAGSGGAAAAGPFLYRQPVTQEQEGFADGFVKALADLHKQNQLLAAPPPPPLSTPGPCCTARPGPPGAPAAAEPPAVYTNLSGFSPAGPLSPSGSAYPAASAPPPPPPPPGLAFGAAGLGSGRLPPARSLEEPQTVPEVPPSAGGEGGSSAPTPPSLSPLDAESQERLKAERKRLRNRIAASKCRRRKLERIARLEEKVKALKGQNAELAATANLLRAQVTQLQGRVRSHLSSGCHINAAGHPPPNAAAAQPREAPPEAAAAPETSAC